MEQMDLMIEKAKYTLTQYQPSGKDLHVEVPQQLAADYLATQNIEVCEFDYIRLSSLEYKIVQTTKEKENKKNLYRVKVDRTL